MALAEEAVVAEGGGGGGGGAVVLMMVSCSRLLVNLAECYYSISMALVSESKRRRRRMNQSINHQSNESNQSIHRVSRRWHHRQKVTSDT